MDHSFLYGQALDVPVVLSVDAKALKHDLLQRTVFKRPEQIFSYETTLEESILRDFEKKRQQPQAEKSATQNNTTKLPVQTKEKDPVSQLSSILHSTVLEKTVEDKGTCKQEVNDSGMAAAELYLPDETPQKKLAFAKIVNYALELQATDSDALRGFFMFPDDEAKARQYLNNFITLRELGFPIEKIDEALIVNGNDQEKALEYLMQIS